uniref:L-rhamnose mutarotase n=1 Tax=Ciona savignyi TaxID=51511 RepID=H2YJ08_CIOSA
MSKAAKRYGSVIKLNADKVAEYKALHASVWPAVLARLEKSNVRNYTIYYCAQLGLLFSHFEYIGEDFDGDMSAVGEDPVTKDWWKVCEPCQSPLNWEGPPPSEGGKGDWWQPMEEVFHDGHPASGYQ